MTVLHCLRLGGQRNTSVLMPFRTLHVDFFLGVGKYAPNNAVNGDMGWIPPIAKQWTCVVRTNFRLKNMPDERIIK